MGKNELVRYSQAVVLCILAACKAWAVEPPKALSALFIAPSQTLTEFQEISKTLSGRYAKLEVLSSNKETITDFSNPPRVFDVFILSQNEPNLSSEIETLLQSLPIRFVYIQGLTRNISQFLNVRSSLYLHQHSPQFFSSFLESWANGSGISQATYKARETSGVEAWPEVLGEDFNIAGDSDFNSDSGSHSPESEDLFIKIADKNPVFAEYLQEFIDKLEDFRVSRRGRAMAVDAFVPPSGAEYEFLDEDQCKAGQPYGLELSDHMHFEISMERDNIRIDNIVGFKAYVKIPFLPDGVEPYSLYVDTQKQTLFIHAKAWWGLVDIDTQVDLSGKIPARSGSHWLRFKGPSARKAD